MSARSPLRSPYRSVRMSGHDVARQPARRAGPAPMGCKVPRQLHHRFSEVFFAKGEHGPAARRRAFESAKCNYCKQPRFVVEGLPCAGKPKPCPPRDPDAASGI